MAVLHLVILIAAVASFTLKAFNIPSKLDLFALGFAFLALSLIV